MKTNLFAPPLDPQFGYYGDEEETVQEAETEEDRIAAHSILRRFSL